MYIPALHHKTRNPACHLAGHVDGSCLAESVVDLGCLPRAIAQLNCSCSFSFHSILIVPQEGSCLDGRPGASSSSPLGRREGCLVLILRFQGRA